METSIKSSHSLLVLVLVLFLVFGSSSWLVRGANALTLDERIAATSIKLPLDECHKLCDNPFCKNSYLDTCTEECSIRLIREAASECQVFKLHPSEDSLGSPEMAICSLSKCITIPFSDYFPFEISSMNLYHLRDLIGYCIRAGVKSSLFYTDRGNSFHSDLIDQSFGSNDKTSIYNLDSTLLHPSSIITGVASDVIKTQPVFIQSVARLFRDYDMKYRKYRTIISNLSGNSKYPPVLDYDSFNSRRLEQLEMEYSKKSLAGYVYDEVVSWLPGSPEDVDNLYDVESFDGCFINLVKFGNVDDKFIWTITTPEHPETFGHIFSSTLSRYTIPTVIYSREYLRDVCSLVKSKYESGSQNYVISIDLSLYHYDRISLNIPYLFPLFKSTPSSKIIFSTPIFV